MGSKHEMDVRQAADRFYEALNALFEGELDPMKAAWSHADDVVYMGPDGVVNVGWKNVWKDWERQAARKFGGRIEPAHVHIIVGEDLAVMHAVETGENANIEGKARKVAIRATNTFRKEGGAWKMIGHHTDLLQGV